MQSAHNLLNFIAWLSLLVFVRSACFFVDFGSFIQGVSTPWPSLVSHGAPELIFCVFSSVLGSVLGEPLDFHFDAFGLRFRVFLEV